MEWIKVENDLPKKFPVMVLNGACYKPDGSLDYMWLATKIGKEKGRYYAWTDGLNKIYEVTHWMPLPEPPNP